jgi:hypothetical protein
MIFYIKGTDHLLKNQINHQKSKMSHLKINVYQHKSKKDPV